MTVARAFTIPMAAVLENDVIAIKVELESKKISFNNKIA